VRGRRARVWVGIAAVVTLVALFGWANGPEHAWLLGGLSVVLLAIGFFRVQLPRRRRDLAALAENGDLVETYRSDLDLEIKSLRAARPFVPILLIVSGMAIVVNLVLLVKHHLMEEELSWQNAVAMTLALGYLTYTGWRGDRVTLPRLEQERDGIDA
jgi:L-lactate permease